MSGTKPKSGATAPTPGPWVYAPTGQVMSGYSQPFAVAEQGKANLVCGCFGDVSGGNPVAEANARAIAAVPDLIEVLQAAPDFGGAPKTAFSYEYRDWQKRVRAALAKALEP